MLYRRGTCSGAARESQRLRRGDQNQYRALPVAAVGLVEQQVRSGHVADTGDLRVLMVEHLLLQSRKHQCLAIAHVCGGTDALFEDRQLFAEGAAGHVAEEAAVGLQAELGAVRTHLTGGDAQPHADVDAFQLRGIHSGGLHHQLFADEEAAGLSDKGGEAGPGRHLVAPGTAVGDVQAIGQIRNAQRAGDRGGGARCAGGHPLRAVADAQTVEQIDPQGAGIAAVRENHDHVHTQLIGIGRHVRC